MTTEMKARNRLAAKLRHRAYTLRKMADELDALAADLVRRSGDNGADAAVQQACPAPAPADGAPGRLENQGSFASAFHT